MTLRNIKRSYLLEVVDPARNEAWMIVRTTEKSRMNENTKRGSVLTKPLETLSLTVNNLCISHYIGQ